MSTGKASVNRNASVALLPRKKHRNGSECSSCSCSGLTRFFFAGFNTAIYAIIPDCVEYGEWKTGVRNDGFQYAFISLENKIGMAIGTSVFAAVPGAAGFEANMQQKPCCVRK